MEDILIGRIVVKDGVTMLETDIDFWIRQPKDDNPKSDKIKPRHSVQTKNKMKSKVCYDCDFSHFVHSECCWFCTLIDGFTKGYCEVADE
jgi:hypothetical protein